MGNVSEIDNYPNLSISYPMMHCIQLSYHKSLISTKFEVDVLISLSAISPVAFELVRVGDLVSVKKKPPNKSEYRGTLEAAREVFLVFKGVTKVGMIPSKISDTLPDLAIVKNVRVTKMDRSKTLIEIQL